MSPISIPDPGLRVAHGAHAQTTTILAQLLVQPSAGKAASGLVTGGPVGQGFPRRGPNDAFLLKVLMPPQPWSFAQLA